MIRPLPIASKRTLLKDSGKKPQVLPVCFGAIPRELHQRDRWVLWRYDWARDRGEWSKVPYTPRGAKAAVTRPSTWSTFSEVRLAYDKGRYDGVGIVLGDGLAGVDLDECVDPETLEIEPWALGVVNAIDSYVELSPSRTGLKIFALGHLPKRGCRKGKIEMYDSHRYFAVTGHSRGERIVALRTDALLKLHREIFGTNVKQIAGASRATPAPTPLDDDQIVALARSARNGEKFLRLWSGRTSEYDGDDSRADLALLGILVFYTRDPAQLERIFSRSELGRRGKWTERPDYRDRTIKAALAGASETYKGTKAPARDISGTIFTGGDSHQTSLILDPTDPLPSAREFVARHHLVDGVRSLHHQGGVFYEYDINAYVAVDEDTVRARLYQFLERAVRRTEPRDKNEEPQLVRFKPTKPKIENVLDALRAISNLSISASPPCWLGSGRAVLDPLDVLACRNGLLHLPTRELLVPTANFFTLNGLEFDYDPAAPTPERWLTFLQELWEDDFGSQDALQEWFGYFLTPATHLQKILMIVGPKRSGKGTIARVARHLLGKRNVCGPTLAGIGEHFGMSVLIEATLAIIADARISGRTDTAIVTERLLSISGEDPLSVARKYLPDWTGKLPVRFMLLTNELPRIEDVSGALSSRFIVLSLTRSFYGREDHNLLDHFIPELPGILNWAIEGRRRLYARGRFLQPTASAELIQQFEDLGSPIGAFLRDRCELGAGHTVPQQTLYDAWKSWCQESGRERPGSVHTFGRNIAASLPWVKLTRPRDEAGNQVRTYQGLRLKP